MLEPYASSDCRQNPTQASMGGIKHKHVTRLNPSVDGRSGLTGSCKRCISDMFIEDVGIE